MTKFKICGLRDADNALVAADSGADFLGFCFVPGVRRQLLLDDARAVIDELRRRCDGTPPRLVGLFADQPADEVNSTVAACGLDLVQLCGRESRDYMRLIPTPVVKMVKVRDEDGLEEATSRTIRDADELAADGHRVQLDKYEASARRAARQGPHLRLARGGQGRGAARHHAGGGGLSTPRTCA